MSFPVLWVAEPRLQLEVALWRNGWVWLLIAAMAVAALTGWLWWWPEQQRNLASLQMSVEQARVDQSRHRAAPPPSPGITGDDAVLADLQRIGYAETELTDVLRAISILAKAQGISLGQSAFQTSVEQHGGLRQVQITLPMTATYPQLRRFAETVLRQLPGVSVDQFGLKREAVAQGQAEARLKLSVWVDPYKVAARSAVAASATMAKRTPVIGPAIAIQPRREGSP